jgi:hypothetical protein
LEALEEFAIEQLVIWFLSDVVDNGGCDKERALHAVPSLLCLRPHHDRGGWDVELHLALAALWLMLSVDRNRNAIEARARQSLPAHS